jgi:hypothetical protein
MLDKITAALGAIDTGGTFATELTCSADALHLQVDGVGLLRFPISAAAAKELCAVARPAPFGKRDRTLHDRRVRDSWEIGAEQIEIDADAWQAALGPQLTLLQERLGLPEDGTLEASFDKLLIYGPGQFFATHQDSERADDMVGSLVVELPSRHEGGGLAVEHQKEKKVFPEGKRRPGELSLVAFYADCHHEVTPVRSGYRITLTYHLLYNRKKGAAAREKASIGVVEQLVKIVNAYFETKVSDEYARTPPEKPDRLIYLLDHEYTQKSLGWDGLKNRDRLRVDALRQVAERLDCEIFLTLADVHESWSCDEDESDYGYRRRSYRFDEDDEDEDEDEDEDDTDDTDDTDDEDYTLIELIDSGVELQHWIDADGKVVPGIKAAPSEREICFTRASDELDPFKSEHEGYMGNYGNTVDRWYHRAALVMWPRRRNFVVRARVSPTWAVTQLASLCKAGDLSAARTRANELLPFWARTAAEETSKPFVVKLLTVSASLADAELALALLSPLGPQPLHEGALPIFLTLVEQHGLAWSQRLFESWKNGRHRFDAPSLRPLLPRLCEALKGSGPQGQALAPWLLSREVAPFEKERDGRFALLRPYEDEIATRWFDDLLSLLETAVILQKPAIRDGLVALLTAPSSALPPLLAGKLLKKCQASRSAAELEALGLTAFYLHLRGSLEEALQARPRSADDWSIEPPPGCACALCKELSTFLRDRSRIELRWPLAKDGRRHIHNVIDRNALPLTHVTLRSGSPQTLVITKQKTLFSCEAELRSKQKALLDWLDTQRSAFGDPPRQTKAQRRPRAR